MNYLIAIVTAQNQVCDAIRRLTENLPKDTLNKQYTVIAINSIDAIKDIQFAKDAVVVVGMSIDRTYVNNQGYINTVNYTSMQTATAVLAKLQNDKVDNIPQLLIFAQ